MTSKTPSSGYEYPDNLDVMPSGSKDADVSFDCDQDDDHTNSIEYNTLLLEANETNLQEIEQTGNVQIYACMFTYSYIYIHICIYMYIFIYIYIYVYICIYEYKYIHRYMYVYIDMTMRICMSIYVCKCTDAYVF
jgi:hypothetical protein